MKKIIISILIFALFVGGMYAVSPRISIPGTKDKMNSEEIIDKLMMVKKMPITTKEDQNKDTKLEIELLKALSQTVGELNNRTKALYDFQNPFGEMIGTSSDPTSLDAVTSRRAEQRKYKIGILQLAEADSFMSESLPKSKALSPSDFTIKINDEIVTVKFRGGTIDQLAQTLREASANLEVRVINNTPQTVILQMNGKNTGLKNKMVFTGNLKAMYESGLLADGVARTDEKKISFEGIENRGSVPVSGDTTKAQLKSKAWGELDLSGEEMTIMPNSIFVFEADVRLLKAIAKTEKQFSAEFSTNELNKMGNVTVSNVTVVGPELIPYFNETTAEAAQPVTNFTQILTCVFDDGMITPISVNSAGSYTNSFSAFAGKRIVKLMLRNDNTDREIVIANPRLVTVLQAGGVQPKLPISSACDSTITLDGVTVTRDNNNIGDLIPMVTLNLKRETKFPVELAIDHNYQIVIDKIKDWVDSYNKVLDFVNILVKPNLDKTALHLRDKEDMREFAKGVFQTEGTLTTLKTTMRTIVMNAYPTSLAMDLRLLEQIGIYTKKPGAYSPNTEEFENMKIGVLQVDENALKDALHTKFDAVEDLFAYDRDNDHAKEIGIAVGLADLLKNYLGEGYIKKKIDGNTAKIKDVEKDIAKMTEELDDYEMQLREAYGKMNQAILDADSQKKWLESQMK